MGYGIYNFDDGFGDRGYSVPDTCHADGCNEKIDRGLSYVCYGCMKYFCGKHLTMAYDADDNPIKFDCSVGQDSQCACSLHEGSEHFI